MTAASDPLALEDWPGKRLGLPETGPRSIARIGRRIAAIWLDWLIALGLAYLLFEGNSWAILVIFFVMQVIFITTMSGSIGHLIFGMRVVPLNPAWIGPVKPLLRSVMICALIPAVIWDRDQRGLHDRLIGTVLVRK